MLWDIPTWEWTAGIIALVAALWARVRRIFNWVVGWVVVTNMVDSSLISVVLGYLNSMNPPKRRKKLREVGYFNSDNWYVRSLGRTVRVCYRVLSGRSEITWYKKRPLWFNTGEPDETSSFSFIRWTVNWSQLLKEAATWEDDAKQRESEGRANRYEVYKIFGNSDAASSDDEDRPTRNGRSASLDRQLQNLELLHYEKEDIGEPREQASLNNLSLGHDLQDIVEEARYWRKEEPWYKEHGITWRRSFCFSGDPGTGKCLGLGTKVTMANGHVKSVEDIVIGDRLMGPDGSARTVMSTNVGYGNLFKIIPISGDPWICNDVHVLTLAKSRKHRKNTADIIDIPLNAWANKSDSFKSNYKLFSVGVDKFETNALELPIDPYFLGAWFGHGSKSLINLKDGKALVKVALSNPDPEIFHLCEAQAAKWGLRVKTYYENSTRCPTYQLVGDEHANPLLDAFRRLVTPDINVPDIYMRAPIQERLQFLAGYLDTDGFLDNNGYEIVQKRKDWAEAIWWLARSVGLHSVINPKLGTIKKDGVVVFEGDYWRVYISGHTDMIPCRITRKQAGPRQRIRDATRTGFSYESHGQGAYYGFTLDGDGRFLLGDFTVTHNTSLSRGIAEDLDLPIYCPDLATMSNEDFFNAWETAAENAPCMMLIEDIDRVFKGQTNTSKSPLTFDCLLNCIDGAKRPDGILLVITTNHSTVLDPAMLRPGRIDRVVNFKPIGMDGRIKIATRILDDVVMAKEMAMKHSDESPAVFQELCVRIAIEKKFAARQKIA